MRNQPGRCSRAGRPSDGHEGEGEDGGVFEEVASIGQERGGTDPETGAALEEEHGEVERGADDQRGAVGGVEVVVGRLHAEHCNEDERRFVGPEGPTPNGRT